MTGQYMGKERFFLLKAIEDSTDAIFTTDAEGRITYVNPAFGRLYGYSEAEVVGKNPRVLKSGKYKREEYEQFWNTILAGKTVRREFVNRTKDGRFITIETAVDPVLDADGTLLGFIAIQRDITQRKETERSLLESEARFRTLAQSSSAAIFIYEEKFTYVNPAAQLLSGYSDEEMLQMNFWQFVHPDHRDLVRERGLARLQGKPILNSYEFKIVRKDGQVRWVSFSAGVYKPNGHSAAVGTAFDITERKLMEEQLKKHEQLLQSLLETISAGIVIYQGEHFRFANNASQRLLGYSKDELLSKRFWEVIHPDEQDVVRQRGLARQRGEPVPSHVEVRVVTKAGDVRWVDYTASMIEFENQPAVLGTIFDITERKKAEDALAESEERYRTVVEEAVEIIFTTDFRGYFTYANPAGLKISGYTLDELRRLRYRDIVLPEYREKVSYRYIRQLLKREAVSYTEYPFRTKAGEIRWFGQNARLLIEDGQVLGFHVIARDITERKRIEEELKQSEQRYRELFEEALTGNYISTPDGQILACNERFARIFGYDSPEEAMSRHGNDYHLNPQAREKFLNLLRKKKKLEHYEEVAVKKDGTTIHVIENVVGKFNEEGKLVEIHGYVYDNTERKKLEDQIRHAQKMESIGTLASGIAHDLNNILGPILMGAEMLKREMEDPGMLQLVGMIEKSAQRGASVVKQILTFARGMEGGKVVVQPKHLIKEIINLVEETFPKSIKLQRSVPSNLWTVKGDPTQLHQVLLNLCVNARDAMPNGGILRISAESVTLDDLFVSKHPNVEPGRYLQITVTDTGTGIPPEIMEKIFDPFFTTKEVGKGTGLGLSTAIGIVKSHGGFINVYSEVGKGTTFKVYLPASEADETKPVEVVTDDSLLGKGQSILVVDDESSLREMIKTTLESYGYNVLLAKDGAEAVALTAQYQDSIQLVITDIMMPYMDGLATIKAIRRILPEVRVIMTSGLQTNEQEAIAAGASRFILKPFSSNRLLLAIHELLSGREEKQSSE